jgi:natural product precursor
MNKIKLNRLSDRRLAEMQMNMVRGGEGPSDCPNPYCGCLYEGQPGGSTNAANYAANHAKGLHSVIPLQEVVIRPSS